MRRLIKVSTNIGIFYAKDDIEFHQRDLTTIFHECLKWSLDIKIKLEYFLFSDDPIEILDSIVFTVPSCFVLGSNHFGEHLFSSRPISDADALVSPCQLISYDRFIVARSDLNSLMSREA